ncbi:hypothetical protein BG844_23685 [Couchioplanes caeruleus subsp. caeruleus]|uniref:Uncharacterized protein n=1 Tax=Couchioplanes caeruleus subsp. caeruleus TaxID=56427 RepID=A0A1K0FGE9_9ACTN|nr:hypothetical protein BG844_23685 [Couchioplanes caeruleus subsp. caeruleus]
MIEVPPAEAATGATKVVWTPEHGPLTVTIPPGTVDGAVVWVPTPAGTVAVTIRVPTALTPPPVTAPPFPASGPPTATPPFPASGPPAAPPLPASGPPAAAYPPPGYPPADGYPAPGGNPPPGAYAPSGAYVPPGAYGPPPAKPRTGRRNLIIGLSLAALLVVGCCGVGLAFSQSDDDTSEAGKRSGIGAATPTGTGPMSPQQYAQLLAASDNAIRVPFAKLNTGDPAAFARAAQAAAPVIHAEAGKLRATEPPAGAQSVHAQLTHQLDSLGDMVEDTAGAKQECPAASPFATVLRSGWAGGLRENARKLAAADTTYKFGTFLPAAPKEQKRRLKNGTFVKQSGAGGLGHLKIKNGASDTTISLVPSKGTKPKPVFTVYVRGGGTYTAKGIQDGTYRIYTASGEDWNADKKGFTRDCAYSKFDDTFKFTTTASSTSIWTITLTPVVGGNASTSDVDPSTFPN